MGGGSKGRDGTWEEGANEGFKDNDNFVRLGTAEMRRGSGFLGTLSTKLLDQKSL